MKICILGGGGCFALNFATHCQDKGIDHFGIGRSAVKPDPFWQVDRYYRYRQLHLVDHLPAIMAVLDTERPDVVVQFAAQGEGAASFGENAPDFFTTNCVALVRLVIELQKRNYLHRFVQIGSSEVYGSATPAKESDALRPTSPYSVSKAAFDLYLESMWRTSKFPMNIIRPSNCFVEGQQLYRVIPKTIIAALTKKKLPLHGGGRAMKSYLHATDLSRAIFTVIDSAPLGTTYNVGPDEPTEIREIVARVGAACGVAFEDLVTEVPDRIGQDAKYHLDSSAIKALGWSKTINLGDGIGGMVKWIKKYPELLAMNTTYTHRR